MFAFFGTNVDLKIQSEQNYIFCRIGCAFRKFGEQIKKTPHKPLKTDYHDKMKPRTLRRLNLKTVGMLNNSKQKNLTFIFLCLTKTKSGRKQHLQAQSKKITRKSTQTKYRFIWTWREHPV